MVMTINGEVTGDASVFTSVGTGTNAFLLTLALSFSACSGLVEALE